MQGSQHFSGEMVQGSYFYSERSVGGHNVSGGFTAHTYVRTYVHTHTHTHSDKAAFTGHAPSLVAGPPCSLSRDLWASADSLLEPGQVLTGAPTVTPTVVSAPEVPPGPQRYILQPVVFPPPAEARYSFILLSRERQM